MEARLETKTMVNGLPDLRRSKAAWVIRSVAALFKATMFTTFSLSLPIKPPSKSIPAILSAYRSNIIPVNDGQHPVYAFGLVRSHLLLHCRRIDVPIRGVYTSDRLYLHR